MIDPAICQLPGCHEPIPIRLVHGEGRSHARRRKYHSRACWIEAVASQKTRQTPWKLPATLFPHAHLRRLADAPATCHRCGGLWRQVETGLSCLICGKELVVAETLIATLRRGVTLGN